MKSLETYENRLGANKEIKKTNTTNNESGNIKGPHGIIQIYFLIGANEQ